MTDKIFTRLLTRDTQFYHFLSLTAITLGEPQSYSFGLRGPVFVIILAMTVIQSFRWTACVARPSLSGSDGAQFYNKLGT